MILQYVKGITELAAGQTVKGGLKTLRCTIGNAKVAGAFTMRMDSATGMLSLRMRRSISPKFDASAAKLSWLRQSAEGRPANEHMQALVSTCDIAPRTPTGDGGI